MNDLKVVENGLVPIYEDRQARKVINARELHEFLGSGRQFANWIQERIDKYGFAQGEDYTSFNEIVKRENGGGTIRTEYLLTLDTATELGSLFGVSANRIGRIANEYGLKTSEYGIEVLDKAKGHNKQVPTFRYNENGKEKLRVLLTGPEGQA